nr:hypothetical protein [Methylobacterium indicum]
MAVTTEPFIAPPRPAQARGGRRRRPGERARQEGEVRRQEPERRSRDTGRDGDGHQLLCPAPARQDREQQKPDEHRGEAEGQTVGDGGRQGPGEDRPQAVRDDPVQVGDRVDAEKPPERQETVLNGIAGGDREGLIGQERAADDFLYRRLATTIWRQGRTHQQVADVHQQDRGGDRERPGARSGHAIEQELRRACIEQPGEQEDLGKREPGQRPDAAGGKADAPVAEDGGEAGRDPLYEQAAGRVIDRRSRRHRTPRRQSGPAPT